MNSVPIPYLTVPAALVNEALDMIGGSDKTIGDISDGTAVAEVARRNYGQLLRQLFRIAHWNFSRRMAPLTLLADASGQTPFVSTQVEENWQYAYAWPIDAAAVRWMPASLPTNPPANPPITTAQNVLYPIPFIPGRFLVSSSNLYPIEVGTVPWIQQPDLQRTFGVGPTDRTIILTNTCNAQMVYTRFTPIVEEWDASFRQAFVTMLAIALIPVAIDDPRERRTQRNDMIAIAKNMIADARVSNGNEAGFPQGVDHQPLWITARGGGMWGGNGYGQGYSGYTFYPFDSSFSWCGSVF